MSETVHIHIKGDDDGSEKKAHLEANHFDKKVTVAEHLVLIINFILELPSAVFDQLSSVQKPQFALLSMLVSFTILFISFIDLVYKGRKGKVTLKKRGLIPWFYYPNPNSKPFGTFPDIVGFFCSIFQFIFATIIYAFLSKHSDSPIKVSPWPVIFAFGLLYSRLSGNFYAQRNLNPTPILKRWNRAEEFTLIELAKATDNFSLENKITDWRSGVVYKGKLSDGREVAVKRVEMSSERNKFEEEESAFESELTFCSRFHHKHLVRLVGYCIEETERILVHEYMKIGLLYNCLHNNVDKNSPLFKSWECRIKIAFEAAKGIEYLHNYAVPPVIHRNLKSTNVLLDGDWNVRVSEFWSMCPENECSSNNRNKDVYSLGVVFLELLTGKKAIFKDVDNRGIPRNLVDFAVPKILGNELVKVLDYRICPPESANEAEAVEMMAYTAVHCVNSEAKNRPNIISVVANLEQALFLCYGRSNEKKAKL